MIDTLVSGKSIVLLIACLAALACPGMALAASSEELLAISDLWDRGKHKEANARLEPLVEAGDQDAIGMLGILYFYGKGLDKDQDKAYELCLQSAEHEQPMGMRCMGFIYGRGIDGKVEPDYQQAAYWFSKGAEAGDSRSMLWLGEHYLFGSGVEKNEKEALLLWEKAAAAGDKYAFRNLAVQYERGEIVEKDSDKSFEYFLAGVRAGIGFRYQNVQLFVAEHILIKYDDEQLRQEGLGMIREVADWGLKDAWLRLGYFCLVGRYVPQDLDCADRWYGKALNSNDDKAQFVARFGLVISKLFRLVF